MSDCNYLDCERCGGEGSIVDCCDDLCRAQGACMHGDGEQTCPDCLGVGRVYVDDDRWYPPNDETGPVEHEGVTHDRIRR